MKIETVGSFLPREILINARHNFERGIISGQRLSEIEDDAVKEIVERQIACGLSYVTSGELRRKHWANDYWFGLNGISCEHIDSGHIYQHVETSADLLRISGKIQYNPNHPFFDDFLFLHETVAGRAKCRQTLPSPSNLLLEIYALSDARAEYSYSPHGNLIEDIAEAYRKTALRLYALGCNSLQYDDTALGLMCDDNYTKRLLQGGVDLLNLHDELIKVINVSLEGLPTEMETSIYISGGDKIVPEWEYIAYPDNIMPKAFSTLCVDKFFIPFNLDNDYAINVLRHIPQTKEVIVGVADAHTPFSENPCCLKAMIDKIMKIVQPSRIGISHRTGFKLSSYNERALLYEDQWRKITELSTVCT